MRTVRSVISAIDRVNPNLAGRVALHLFAETSPRLPLRDSDAATMAAAERSTLYARGREVATYGWGRGDETVLLVHGWRGRASQFAPLVRELVAERLHVVAFDAPAHGESPYAATDIRDWIAAIEAMQRKHGRFRAVVGHSFGALAALTAVRSGTAAPRVAAVAGTGTPRVLLDEFTRMLDLTPRSRAAFEQRFRARLGEDEASMIRRFDAVADPLPPGVELLALHDDGDRQMPPSASADLVAAHAGRARLIRTSGLGHNRILSDDVTLDAVTAFAVGGLANLNRARARDAAEH